MKPDSTFSTVRKIMIEFAEATGLSPAGKFPRRYLWTDAFAVCNFLELYRRTGNDNFRSLALQLVDQVHNTLGRHRDDDVRTGWISGLGEAEGKLHPTAGGLRIGKKMNERGPADRLDEDLEWDRDGQYYHYLTKWMHALGCASMVTSDPTYNIWARELAKAVHARFIFTPLPDGPKYIYWKMSIDLSRPLVPSMGQHDPLDGFITYNRLQASGDKSEKSLQPDLAGEIAELAEICRGKNWVTNDALGLGGLLCNAYQVAQMIANGHIEQEDLLETLLVSSLPGLGSYVGMNTLALPASYRLAFRELGLSIGMHAVERLKELLENKADQFKKRERLCSKVEELMKHGPLIEKIEQFWLEDANREANTWLEHRDINMVMLATSLAPDGFLQIF